MAYGGAKSRFFAKGRMVRGSKTGLESLWARHLDVCLRAGDILCYEFEAVKLRIGTDTCFYTPDYLVVYGDGVLGFDECKGWWQDDALVKIKVAAAKFPYFRFRSIATMSKKKAAALPAELPQGQRLAQIGGQILLIRDWGARDFTESTP